MRSIYEMAGIKQFRVEQLMYENTEEDEKTFDLFKASRDIKRWIQFDEGQGVDPKDIYTRLLT